MKKIASIVLLIFVLSIQAQKKAKKIKEKEFTSEQQTTLTLKRMTLALDLTKEQQSKLNPIIATKIATKKAFFKKRKAAKKNRLKLSSDERFAMKNELLDKEIEMQNKIKQILDDEQYEKFKKMKKGRKTKIKKRAMKKRKKKHKQKEQKN